MIMTKKILIAAALMMSACASRPTIDGDDGQRDQWSAKTRTNANPSAMRNCPSRDLSKCREDNK